MSPKPTFSFEFFPPRDEEAQQRLWDVFTFLSELHPRFVSITYGAGGKTRAHTHKLVRRLAGADGGEVAAHLTCVGQTQQELLAIAEDYWQAGVRHLVLLRGDMPSMEAYQQHPEGFASTPDFISAVRKLHPFYVSVSAYPEKHPESASVDADLDLLKAKQAAGANQAIGQFCFDEDLFLRLRDRAADLGIAIPIVPGIIQTTNFKGLAVMAEKSGASVPAWLSSAYEKAGDDLAARQALATEIAVRQCQTLQQHGVEHFHFYTLNQKKVIYNVCQALLC